MRLFTAFLLLSSLMASASTPWEYTSSAMNFRPYPVAADADASDTIAVPEGYRLFSLQHYGRHGSRFHTDFKRQEAVAGLLRSYTRTASGDSLLADIEALTATMTGRTGELTALGASQHIGIARRMVQSAPALFHAHTRLDARSSFTVRCILSMANAIGQIRADVPGIRASIDASHVDARITRNERGDADKKVVGPALQALKAYRNANTTGTAWIDRLLKPGHHEIQAERADSLADALHEIMANATSEGILLTERNIFTPEETEAIHRRINADWFLYAGNYKPFNGRRPGFAADLLRDIIARADSAITAGDPHVDLRYGHESMLLPLLALMDINGYGREFSSLDSINCHWDAGYAFPMAANLQLYFARPVNGQGEVLVRAYLNEEPAHLPVPPSTDGWTRWSALKKFYLKKL